MDRRRKPISLDGCPCERSRRIFASDCGRESANPYDRSSAVLDWIEATLNRNRTPQNPQPCLLGRACSAVLERAMNPNRASNRSSEAPEGAALACGRPPKGPRALACERRGGAAGRGPRQRSAALQNPAPLRGPARAAAWRVLRYAKSLAENSLASDSARGWPFGPKTLGLGRLGGSAIQNRRNQFPKSRIPVPRRYLESATD